METDQRQESVEKEEEKEVSVSKEASVESDLAGALSPVQEPSSAPLSPTKVPDSPSLPEDVDSKPDQQEKKDDGALEKADAAEKVESKEEQGTLKNDEVSKDSVVKAEKKEDDELAEELGFHIVEAEEVSSAPSVDVKAEEGLAEEKQEEKSLGDEGGSKTPEEAVQIAQVSNSQMRGESGMIRRPDGA